MKLQNQRIVIPCITTYEFIYLKDVVRFEGAYNSSKVYLHNGSVLTSTLRIGDYKKILKDYNFFCCHKSHVINIVHIDRYHKESMVEMTNGFKVPVSRRNREQFFSEIIQNYHIGELALRTESNNSLLRPTPDKTQGLLSSIYGPHNANAQVINEVTL